MASISGNVTIAGDPDDWVACAFDADTHGFAGVATVSAGTYEITGLTAGKAYVVACRPKTGGVWSASSYDYALNSLAVPSDPVTNPYIFKATSADPGDASFGNVELLFHFEGTNGSTTFTDVAGHSIASVVGNAQISTALAKFGDSSALFDGSGDYVQITDSADFDIATNEDFTMEAWVYPTLFTGGNRAVLGLQAGGNTNYFGFDSSGRPAAAYYLAGTITGASAASLNTWHHLALSRVSNAMKLFLNGEQVGSTVTSGSSSSPTVIMIGAGLTNGYYFSGYIDELRFTVGVGRYSDSFTPPTSAFYDAAGTSSGATEPTWPSTTGATVIDGGVTWTNMGQLVRPLMHGPLIAA